MDKIKAIDSLLPGFQDFLADLALINLTSGLRQQVEDYQQRINDHIEQHQSAPDTPLPPIPKITGKSTASLDIEKLRQEAWRRSKESVDLGNEYQNSEVGLIPEDLYEEPMSSIPPKLPSMDNRPPIIKTRVVDTTEDVYEDPDDSTNESGRGSMPPGSVSDEGSGSTFIFAPGEIPEDDYNSDSTDYDPVEPEERHISEKPKKKVDKVQEFRDEHASETDIDLIDRLFYYNNMISTMKAGISLGKWEKRFCIAQDGVLFLYKSSKDKKAKAQKVPMMGLDVWYIGVQSNRDFVFRITHSSMKHPLLLASDSKLGADKWVVVLNRYATINDTITPSSGYQVEHGEGMEESSTGRKGKFFTRDNKKEREKDFTPQLEVDGAGHLTGYVNIFGVKYGEPKIKRKWIDIHNKSFTCSAGKDELKLFSFNMKGLQIDVVEKKEVKMKGAFKLSQEGEVLLYIEALNMLDAGKLLKTLLSESLGKPQSQTSTTGSSDSAEDGMVQKLLAAYENLSNDQTDDSQKLSPVTKTPSPTSNANPPGIYIDIVGAKPEEAYQNSSVLTSPSAIPARRRSLADVIFSKKRQEEHPLYDDTVSPSSPDDIYDDVDVALTPEVKTPQQRKVLTLGHLRGKKDKALDVPQAEKKETEKERKAREKKEKKEKDKREKDEKKRRKKEAGEEAAVAKEVEEEKASPSPAPSPSSAKSLPSEKKEEAKKLPGLERKTSGLAAAQSKIKDSEMGHFIIKDKLMQDRKELEVKKKEAMKRKADLRAKMIATSDPREKESLKQQVEVVQSEWSQINKQLVTISVEIEATRGERNDENSNETKGAAAAVVMKNTTSPKALSPDREKVSKGTVQDRMKMFQQN